MDRPSRESARKRALVEYWWYEDRDGDGTVCE